MNNLDWLKKARAKRIAKIQRRKRIDNYIKNRVYIILFGLLIAVAMVVISIDKVDEYQTYVSESNIMFNNMLTKTMDDKLIKQNQQLLHILDSMQVLIFAYNRQHQRDQQEIVRLRHSDDKQKKRVIEAKPSNINLNNKEHEESILDFKPVDDSINYYLSTDTFGHLWW